MPLHGALENREGRDYNYFLPCLAGFFLDGAAFLSVLFFGAAGFFAAPPAPRGGRMRHSGPYPIRSSRPARISASRTSL